MSENSPPLPPQRRVSLWQSVIDMTALHRLLATERRGAEKKKHRTMAAIGARALLH
jgi:hypothetical protein